MRKNTENWVPFDVFFHDEVHGVPCGRRIVEAVIGRKWVKLRERGETRCHRTSVTVWFSLRPVQTVLPKKRRKA